MKKIFYLFLLFSSSLFAQHLGELPARTSMRVYYHLENVNDASGNGNTLTNVGTVSFNAGKFTKGADFGTSGTTKRLGLTTNVLSGLNVANVTVRVWYKASTLTGTAAGARIFEYNSINGTSGSDFFLWQTKSGANFNWTFGQATTSVAGYADYTMVADLNWHYYCVVKSTSLTSTLYIDGNKVATVTGTGTQVSAAGTYLLAIGNSRIGNTNQIFGILDEFVIEERAWTDSEIRKDYTQSLGRFQIIK